MFIEGLETSDIESLGLTSGYILHALLGLLDDVQRWAAGVGEVDTRVRGLTIVFGISSVLIPTFALSVYIQTF